MSRARAGGDAAAARRSAPDEIEDFTLCHGAAGAADVLLCGAAALGRGGRAGGLGLAALERHGERRRAMAVRRGSRNDARAVPRARAGSAWWFLRLHDPAIPSPLTLPMNG